MSNQQRVPGDGFTSVREFDEGTWRRLNRRRFLAAGLGVGMSLVGAAVIQRQPRVGGVPTPLRPTLDLSSQAADGLGSPTRPAPTHARTERTPLRVNGLVGLETDVDPDLWSMRVEVDGTTVERFVPADLDRLPNTTQTVEHRCVEGWSNIVTWSGVSIGDLLDPGRHWPRYVKVSTPDGTYSSAMTTETFFHPQTLVATSLNERPLTPDHGAPARLVVPIAWGYKSLKRIGVIRFIDERPTDYWHQRGYDWNATL